MLSQLIKIILKEKPMANGKQAQEFLEKNIQYDEKGDGHVSQQAYYDYMASAGITKEIIDAKLEAQEELVRGLFLTAAHKLGERVDEAKKEGRDGKDEGLTINVKIPKGNIKLHMDASRTFLASQAVGDKSAPRKPITKTCVIRLDTKNSAMLGGSFKETIRTVENEMRARLGLK